MSEALEALEDLALMRRRCVSLEEDAAMAMDVSCSAGEGCTIDLVLDTNVLLEVGRAKKGKLTL